MSRKKNDSSEGDLDVSKEEGEVLAAFSAPEPPGTSPSIPEPEASAPRQSVKLAVWVQMTFGTRKADKAAAFIHWCGKNGKKAMSVREWKDLFDQFQKAPVGVR